jgi:Protein of unknown function (DUF3311)
MNDTRKPPRGRLDPAWSGRDTAVLVLGLVMLVAVTFPGYALANRVDPILLGMPFGMFWIVSTIVVGAIALLFIYRGDRSDPKE